MFMLIKKLTLRNFTKFDNKEILFSNKINAIIAPNGAGKTSIVTAIGICLFNAYGSISKLIKYGKKQSELELEFTVYNDLYKIVRRFGKTSYTSLSKNDVIISSTSKDVYDYIYKLLDTSTDVYKNILHISSSNLIYPFSTELSRRKPLFDSILDLSKYEDYWNKLKDVAKILDQRLNDLEKNKSFRLGMLIDVNKTTQLIDDLSDQLFHLKENQAYYLSNKELIDRRSSIHKELAILEKELLDNTSRIRNISDRQRRLNENKCYICNSELTQETNKRISLELDTEYKNLSTKYYDLQLRIDSLRTELDNTKTIPDLRDVSGDIIRIESRIEIYKFNLEKNSSIDESIKKINDQILIVNKKLSFLNDVRAGIRKIPAILVNNKTKKISLEASKILSELMDSPVEVIFDNIYSTYVRFDDIELTFDQLSEGQKVLTSLSIRIAIINQLTDLGFIIMDEPTINLDSNSRRLLAENISKVDGQIIVISHDDTFSNYIDNVIKI